MGKSVFNREKKINASFKILSEAPPAACNNPQAAAMGQVLDEEANPEILFSKPLTPSLEALPTLGFPS